MSNQVERSVQPQIELRGIPDFDEMIRYQLFESIGVLAYVVHEELGEIVEITPATVRNLLTLTGQRRIDYLVWGLPASYIEDLERYLDKGQVPATDRNEVLIGGFAARHFELDVGDTIDITLAENPIDNVSSYVVSGILNDNVEYFRGALIISREHWIYENGFIDYNFIFMNIDNDNEYLHTMEVLENIDDNLMALASVHDFYRRGNGMANIIEMYAIIISMNILFVFILLSYTMKGIYKKIGLLKSIGLPDSYILKTYSVGYIFVSSPLIIFGVLLGIGLVTFLNRTASIFYGFPVTLYRLDMFTILSVVALNMLNIIITIMITAFLCKKVSPRKAMMKL
jgi:ABC-type lipoprotein release transport system permease subunit